MRMLMINSGKFETKKYQEINSVKFTNYLNEINSMSEIFGEYDPLYEIFKSSKKKLPFIIPPSSDVNKIDKSEAYRIFTQINLNRKGTIKELAQKYNEEKNTNYSFMSFYKFVKNNGWNYTGTSRSNRLFYNTNKETLRLYLEKLMSLNLTEYDYWFYDESAFYVNSQVKKKWNDEDGVVLYFLSNSTERVNFFSNQKLPNRAKFSLRRRRIPS